MSSGVSNVVVKFDSVRQYGRFQGLAAFASPELVNIQQRSFANFLQADTPSIARKNQGLEAIINEIFPIESFDEKMRLVCLGYELSKARNVPDECRQLKLTYGTPFKIRVRLEKDESGEAIEEEVYLGEIPIMIGGGEFIINGAERVIVSQLHRSPGVDFSEEVQAGAKRLQSCWIIPERGSWIEVNVTKKDMLTVRIDQSGKLSATCLLRAMSEQYSSDEAILRHFYEVETVSLKGRDLHKKLLGRVPVTIEAAEEVAASKSTAASRAKKAARTKKVVKKVADEGEDFVREVILKDRKGLTEDQIDALVAAGEKSIEVLKYGVEDDRLDKLVLNCVAEDRDKGYFSHEAALLEIYKRLRPGNPPQIEKAKKLLEEKFFDPSRYRLGNVGRFRLNRKFGNSLPETNQTLQVDDYVNALDYVMQMRKGDGEKDDIDHLGNRRVRALAELAGDEFRKGFLKLKRTIQERMNQDSTGEGMTPRSLINSKTISSAIDYFFGRGELSQVVAQTNPLDQLTHERRLSALGPGGLNRKRAGFEVRDVHTSHYGRICPIETPEGTNIGLIASLGIYSDLDRYGFLTTPYRKVKNGKLTEEVCQLRADQEHGLVFAPADTSIDAKGKISGDLVQARQDGEFIVVPVKKVDFMDVSPKQLVGVSASLIPFLEHDDANRALMGSNMQRQAVPLMIAEQPIVSTGMEEVVARSSSMVVKAEKSGLVTRATSDEIVIDDGEPYSLRKFVGLNERTCLNQRPIVRKGDRVKKGQVIADGAGTRDGKLALGRNILVAFLSWEGFNFEDAIVVSEELVKIDAYTSIHIDDFEVEIRETKLGREEFTRDIPNVSEKMLRNLDDEGICRIGCKVRPDDILVGKVAPKTKTELSPEEKLLHEIFGRHGEDVKNDSLKLPAGAEGIMIGAKKFSRKINISDEERKQIERKTKEEEQSFSEFFRAQMKEIFDELRDVVGGSVKSKKTGRVLKFDPAMSDAELKTLRNDLHIGTLDIGDRKTKIEAARRLKLIHDRIDEAEDRKTKFLNKLQRGDELSTGVLEMVKVYVAAKRRLSVGDKVAGRHGNKGVIAKILPIEDMPFLADGTPVQMLLNPLGVPSRMNVGQILETHLGWAAATSGFQAVTPVFDGCKESQIEEALDEAGLPTSGKTKLYDGRSGGSFEQEVTVGHLYMLKLHHLVDDKIHARATGPYSLITQQPLGGKARFGGQRFGEMEVWALEAYGAAHILQELLTVKSDDVEGRTKIYEAMVKGENTLVAGTPVSFEVLVNEIKGLALDLQLKKKLV
ncbi:MAG: DNA-directed RNA polymerase subunit beta [Planctomycetota bacterium]|nr:DNA-directed RNA polymerase subunit beta [Planctomycetota bacterium]